MTFTGTSQTEYCHKVACSGSFTMRNRKRMELTLPTTEVGMSFSAMTTPVCNAL